MFRPQGLLAALAVPTIVSLCTTRQLRLLLPSRTCIVTVASIGYANYLNRAIGSKKTFTSLVLRFASCSGIGMIKIYRVHRAEVA